MDAEEFFRRKAAELLAEYPGLTPEEIAREMKASYGGDPEIAATVLAVAADMKARAWQARPTAAWLMTSAIRSPGEER